MEIAEESQTSQNIISEESETPRCGGLSGVHDGIISATASVLSKLDELNDIISGRYIPDNSNDGMYINERNHKYIMQNKDKLEAFALAYQKVPYEARSNILNIFFNPR